jgi:hypothetical protein
LVWVLLNTSTEFSSGRRNSDCCGWRGLLWSRGNHDSDGGNEWNEGMALQGALFLYEDWALWRIVICPHALSLQITSRWIGELLSTSNFDFLLGNFRIWSPFTFL